MKKVVRESVLCLLTVIPIITVISWTCTVRWLTRKKYQASCIFQKTQNLGQICCFNEEKNDPMCFSDRFEAAKNFQGRVFCEGLLPKSLLPWLGETVLPDGFLVCSGKHPFYFIKLNIMTRGVFVMQIKMSQCVFLARVKLQLSRFH